MYILEPLTHSCINYFYEIFLVFDILLRINGGNNWQEALLQVLPERKNAQPISHDESKCQNLETEEKVDLLDLKD